ncbi:MAG: APC family permease [Solirubrobacterales bacterium]|jgi:amino acid transporter
MATELQREPDARPRVGPAPAEIQPPSVGYGLKRFVLGPALPTSRLAHERLRKLVALPVFASDAMSSVAYGTEEILRVLVPVAGVAAFSLVFPISLTIGCLLVILMFSYRQTIKAYPSAGGAYIVTKDNFGLLPAQVAGVALLTDYVLTVAVSISAGVAAIVTAATALYPYRVPIALGFLLILVWGNLRGVRESGRMFAFPPYLFIAVVMTMLLWAVYRLTLGGGIPPMAHANLPASPPDVGLLSGVALFIVLKALSSGTAALTGVEAISNGVPAFKPPEWKNARHTLVVMGTILGTMFIGVSYLAHRLQITPDLSDRRTVLGMMAERIFGSSAVGHAGFLALQILTMAILVLAANTSFADFPRLANFHAGDAFLPRQFTTRGHRLVFSNGVIALAAAAGVLIVLFDANVTRLIPFYAIGVFTSFSMSQAGMARRHRRLREPGWRLGLAVNGVGAVATGIVTIVIGVTKFPGDAAILVLVPAMVWLLVRMNHQYEREFEELDEDLEPFDRSRQVPPIAVVLVDALDRTTTHALQYAKTIKAADVRAVHLERDPATTAELERAWAGLVSGVPLDVVLGEGDPSSAIAGYVAALPRGAEVNVIVPGPATMGRRERLRRWREGANLSRALLPYVRARITLVRDHPGPGHPLIDSHDGRTRLRLTPRFAHEVVVLVDRADRASFRAIRYAMSLGADDVWAVHAAVDQHNQETLIRRWMELGVPVQLDVVECWDRNVARALERQVADLVGRGREITVVMPRRDHAQLRGRILHDRTSRKILKALGRYEHVDIAVVPYFFAKRRPPVRPADVPLGQAVR